MTERLPQLHELLPGEFMSGAHETGQAIRYAFVDVVARYQVQERPWPGKHKHISVWFVLANGYAVGWNTQPRTSFPVVRYRDNEPVTIPREVVELRFTGALHEKYHRVLMKAEFSFCVSSDYIVGFDYQHPETGIRVALKEVDGVLEHWCLKPDGVGVYDSSDFTEAEQASIAQAPDDVEVLRRELQVLLPD